jgi:hypothetical protein
VRSLIIRFAAKPPPKGIAETTQEVSRTPPIASGVRSKALNYLGTYSNLLATHLQLQE